MAQFEVNDGIVTRITVEENDVDIVIPKVINNAHIFEVDCDLVCDKSINSISVEDNFELVRFRIMWRTSSNDYTINKISVNTSDAYIYCYEGSVDLLEQFNNTYISMYGKGVQNYSFPNLDDSFHDLSLEFYPNESKPTNVSLPKVEKDSLVVGIVSQAFRNYGTLEEFLKNLTITTKEGTSSLPPSVRVTIPGFGLEIYLYGKNRPLPVLSSTPTRIFKGWTYNGRSTYKNSDELFTIDYKTYSTSLSLTADFDDLCNGGSQQVDLPFIEHHPEEPQVNLSQGTREAISNIHNKFAMFR